MYEKKIKKTICAYEELITFIRFISTQIEYFSYPLTQIYEKYEDKSELINGIISQQKLPPHIFSEVITKSLHDFFSTIGKGYKKEQIKLCEYTISQLDSTLEEVKKASPQKIKVFRSISLFVGISAIILII